MKIETKDVEHVADLARLRIDSNECEKYTKQLNDILSEIEKINDVEVTETDILIAPTNCHDVFRPDEIGASLSKEELFQNSKHREGDYLVVPKVLE